MGSRELLEARRIQRPVAVAAGGPVRLRPRQRQRARALGEDLSTVVGTVEGRVHS